MNLKATITTSLLLLATSSLSANVAQCCFEAREITGDTGSFCGTEENLAEQLGQDYSQRNRFKIFGISKTTRRLPVPNETTVSGSTRPIEGVQNAGYLMAPKEKTHLNAVIPAYKHISATAGSECVAVSIQKLDQAYTRFENLERTSANRTIGAPAGSCLISIQNIQGILNHGYIAQLKNGLKQRNIYLLDNTDAEFAQVTVRVPSEELAWNNNQFDIGYQLKGFFNNKSASFNTNVIFDYGIFGQRAGSFEANYNLKNVVNDDQLDLTVLQNSIIRSLNIDTCRSIN